MIHRVTITTEAGNGITVEHAFEHLVETVEDAEEQGELDAKLTKAWSVGFSKADLS